MATDARLEIWRGLLLGQRSMLLRLGAELKQEHGLTVPQYEALLALHDAPDHRLPMSALARELLYSSGSASHLVTRLVERGWVRRVESTSDARVVEIHLTATGLERITEATRAHVASLREQFSPLIGDDEVTVLLAFARRLAAREEVESVPSSLVD